MATTTPTPPRSAPDLDHAASAQPVRRGLVFVIIALALIMAAIDSTIVATALHALKNGLHTSINWAGWTLTGYAFGLTLMLPVSGKLGERYGGRRVFLASVTVFTLASLLCGLTDNIYVLIVLRVLQAAGGAGFTPAATGIIVDHFGGARDRAVSLFGTIFPIGAMIGPVFGGYFVTYWSWRAVFFVNVPIGIAILALAWRFVPHDRHKRPRGGRDSLDLPGMALLGTSILAAMLAINALGDPGTRAASPQFWVPLLIAGAGVPLFWRHIRHDTRPFILPRLLTGAGFGSVNLINALYGGMTIGSIALVPLYATNRYGINALQAGSLLIAQGLATIVVSVMAVALLRRTGYRRPLYLGGTLMALGVAVLALAPPFGLAPYYWLIVGTLFIGAGNGIANPASRNAGLQLAPDHSATLAALRTLFIQFGQILTIAVITALLAQAHDAGSTQAWAYAIAALVYLAAIPVAARVPEHIGAW